MLCESFHAVATQIVGRHAGVKRQGSTLHQCEVTVMGKNTSIFTNWPPVKIQAVTHGGVNATTLVT